MQTLHDINTFVFRLKKCLESALYLLADEIRRLSLQFIKCRVLDINTAVKVEFSIN